MTDLTPAAVIPLSGLMCKIAVIQEDVFGSPNRLAILLLKTWPRLILRETLNFAFPITEGRRN